MTISQIKKLPRSIIKTDAEGTKKKPAKRGEHIINNNVLKLFQQVVEEFLASEGGYYYRELIENGSIKPTMKVFQACNFPLSQPYKNAVMHELKVMIDEGNAYVDANATLYGIYKQYLQKAVVMYMRTVRGVLTRGADRGALPGLERALIDRVETFIAGEIFIDEHALAIWLEQGGSRPRYEEVKAQVVRMFRRLEYHDGNDELIQWVKDLNEAINTHNQRR